MVSVPVVAHYVGSLLCHFAASEYYCVYRVTAAVPQMDDVCAQEKSLNAGGYEHNCPEKERLPEVGYAYLGEHTEERRVQDCEY